MGFYQADSGQRQRRPASRRGQEPERRAASRHRHGLPALHAGREHDRRREPGARARRRAAIIDWKREKQAIERFMDGMPFRDPARPHGAQARRRRKAEARDPEAALPRQQDRDPGRADQSCSRRKRPTRCSACCATWRTRGCVSVAMITHKFREVTGLRRRGHGAAPRAPGGHRTNQAISRPRPWPR